ncbi:MAG: hypothetical protein ABIV48_09675 [Pyrinomonadaceae bacterium]
MIRPLSEKKALERLQKLTDDFKQQIAVDYEHKAKDCLTCETKGACCLDAHFVNVHISQLEAAAIKKVLGDLPATTRRAVNERIENTIERYDLTAEGDTFARTYACPLFEKGIGCLVHESGKPAPCIAHACYENKTDLPPDELLIKQERLIDDLNTRTYGGIQPILPLPLAIRE